MGVHDDKDILSKQRKFVVPLILLASIFFMSNLILHGSSAFIIAGIICTFGALIITLIIHKASTKTLAFTLGGIILAVAIGFLIGSA